LSIAAADLPAPSSRAPIDTRQIDNPIDTRQSTIQSTPGNRDRQSPNGDPSIGNRQSAIGSTTARLW
jgi:hypothetical protein